MIITKICKDKCQYKCQIRKKDLIIFFIVNPNSNQMKKIILVSLLIALSLSFVLKEQMFKIKKQIEGADDKELLKACTNNETNAVYNAINSCQIASEFNTTDCISNSLMTKINEKWNVFTKRANSFAGVAFWVYNNCSINLNNYGTYNRTYTAWPSQLYNSKLNADSNCTIARNSTVYQAVNGCEMYDETDSAKCIINALKVNLNEYWNSYVASQSAFAAVKYWYFDNCTVTFSNHGRYNRTYIAWKAY